MKYPYGFIPEQFHHSSLFKATQEFLYRCGWILFEGILSILALAGIVSVAFGMILFFFPGAGILSILWLVGIYGIVFGLLFIVPAFQLRSWASSVTAYMLPPFFSLS